MVRLRDSAIAKRIGEVGFMVVEPDSGGRETKNALALIMSDTKQDLCELACKSRLQAEKRETDSGELSAFDNSLTPANHLRARMSSYLLCGARAIVQ